MIISAYTHIGGRENNEDSYYVDPKKRFAILADGMGGHAAGEKASALAVNRLKEVLSVSVENERELLDLLNKGVHDVNQEIFNQSAAHLKYRGMGTTLSLIYLLKGKLYYINIGDISEEEARVHPKKNVLTKALGTTQGVDFQIRSLDTDLKFIILCSDGLSDVVERADIQKVLETQTGDYAKTLVEKALDGGGKDNITVIVLDKSR